MHSAQANPEPIGYGRYRRDPNPTKVIQPRQIAKALT
jgi:hypothetical protein